MLKGILTTEDIERFDNEAVYVEPIVEEVIEDSIEEIEETPIEEAEEPIE